MMLVHQLTAAMMVFVNLYSTLCNNASTVLMLTLTIVGSIKAIHSVYILLILALEFSSTTHDLLIICDCLLIDDVKL